MKAFINAMILILGLATATTVLAKEDPIEVVVPQSLEFIKINGRNEVYYELKIRNISSDTILINTIEVLNESGLPSTKIGSGFSAILVPQNATTVYMELSLADTQLDEILHQINYQQKDADSERLNLQTGQTKCFYDRAIVLGNPLSGGPWAAVYDPAWERGHRRVIYEIDGIEHIPGRYAIDFIKLDHNGKYAEGDEDVIKNWLGYGADVLAVAAGLVVAVQDTFPESNTIANHPHYSSEQATGNYVVLKVQPDMFVFYEHLKPGSIRVKTGQRVKEGEVLAQVGFTGQTTGPHLHMHVANKNSPLGAEGIPFVFKDFASLGRYRDFSVFGKKQWTPLEESKSGSRQTERPEPNSVIQFN